jgi:hypothetical protein
MSRQDLENENKPTGDRRPSGFDDTLKTDASSAADLSKSSIFVERTLALVKPDAILKANDIESIILQHGFTILYVRTHSLIRVSTRIDCCSI